ncbi:MAG: iron dependent repressor, metal binding and dimerization domain protein [Dehalobacterium sp.]
MDKSQEFHTVRGYQLLDQDKKLLTSAMEDYLEMIYRNILSEGYMRINTLSQLLNVRPSSTTKMVQKLTRLGLLKYEKYGVILMTDKGRDIGAFLLKRHDTIETFLKTIGITDNILVETELIEHNVSSDTLKCIEMLNTFFISHEDLLNQFEKFKEENFNEKESKKEEYK